MKQIRTERRTRRRDARVAAVWVVVAALLGVLGGCTTRRAARAPTPAGAGSPYRFEAEGRVPRLEPNAVRREVDHVDTFEEMPVDESGIEFESVLPVTDVEPAIAPEDSTVLRAAGYRVQVFATADRERAEMIRREAEAALGLTAYITQIDGIFKVRVGDCVSRRQAEAALRQCRQAGYGDAWIVSEKVVMPRSTH